MAQYIPEISERDVARIVGRDYPAEARDAIHEMIRAVEVREKTRVVLARLKNAGGDLETLRGELANA